MPGSIDDIQVGTLAIPVEFRIDQKKLDARFKKDVEAHGKKIGKKQAEAHVDTFVKQLDRQFRLKKADAREAFERGLITEAEMEQQGKKAARAFNDGVLREIERRGRAGTLKDDDFLGLSESMKKTAKEGTRSFRDQLGGLSTWIRGTFAAAAIAGIALVGAGIVRVARQIKDQIDALFTRAGSFQEARRGFESVAASRGIDPAGALDGLRRALRGTVPDAQLFVQAQRAIQNELPVTAANLERLGFLTRRLAEAQGKDVPDSLRRMIEGIGKLEPELLDELGIITRLEDALRDWELQTGRSSDSLSRAEKTALFFNAVMDEAERKVANLGRESFNAKRPIDQMAAAVENYKDRAAEAIAESPKLRDLFRAIGEAADEGSAKIENAAIATGAVFDALLEKFGPGTPAGKFLGFFFGLGKLELKIAGKVLGMDESIEQLARVRRLIADIRAEQSQAALVVARIGVQAARRGDGPFAEFGPEELNRVEEALEDRIRLLKRLAGAQDEVADATERMSLEEKRQLEREREATEKRLGDLGDDLTRRLTALTATATDNLRAQIDEMEATAAEAVQKAKEAGAAIPEGFEQGMREGIAALRENARLVGVLEEFQQDFRVLKDAGATSGAQEDLEIFAQRLSDEIDLIEEGSAAQRTFIDLLRRALGLRRENAKEIEREGGKTERKDELTAKQAAALEARIRREELRDLRDRARLLEENARAAIQLANAFGVVSDDTARALENVAQLGSAVARIAAGDLTAIPSAIGALAQTVKGLFGGQEAEELMRQLQENARQIRENTEALKGFRETALSGITADERSAIDTAGQKIVGGMPLALFGERAGKHGTRKAIEGLAQVTGMTFDDIVAFFEDLEKITGTDFFDLEQDTINLDEFARAWENFQAKGLGAFDDDLLGKLDALAFMWGVLGDGAGSFGDKLREWLEVVDQASKGDFADDLKKTLDEKGAAAADALLDDWARRLAAGDTTLFDDGDIFAGMTASEARRLLEEGNTLLEDFLRGGPDGTTNDFVQARSITTLQGGRMEGALFAANVLGAERNRLLGQLVALQLPAIVTAQRSIGPGAFAGAISERTSNEVHVHMEGGIHVTGGGPSIVEEVRSQVGPAIAEMASDAWNEMNRRGGQARQRKLRAHGRTK